MSIWNRLFGGCSSADNGGVRESSPQMVFNPATGLPMVGNSYTSVDYGGSSFGTNVHEHTQWSPSSTGCGFDNDWMR
ncbi:hypothetical protein B0G57_1094 [Trinickia symbiotica]|uniref:hypothetical protein n=1 Tax=Trinickia symbiotica TaxID=863227 RepID=UPI000D406830|nr:hypothetical protein [Trinickia symbiotica]PPK44171.1 hypothetical protein B0G57_1094 [Trinickia symbiotica]